METGLPVKKASDLMSQQEFIGRPRVSAGEEDLGKGTFYFPIFSFLIWSNAVVFAARYDYLNCKKAFFLSIPATWILAKLTSNFMGDSMYRIASKVDTHTYGSAKIYEHHVKNLENKNKVNA
jgi:hypothetical protein